MDKNERIQYMDILRVMASFFVIIIHVVAYRWMIMEDTQLDMREFPALVLWRNIASASIPLFVMISGANFLNPKRKITIKDIYFKYIFRIAVAFILWSFAYAIFNSHILVEGYTKENIIKMLTQFFKGNYHMWYLYMLAGLYIMIPVLRPVAKDKTASLYFIILCILVSSFPTLFDKVLTIRWFKIIYNADGLSQALRGRLLINVSMYMGYFVAGNYFNSIEIKRDKTIKVLLWMGIIAGVLLSTILEILYSVRCNRPVADFSDYCMPMQVLYSICIFTLIKDTKMPKMSNIINILQKHSFGIYMIHPFIVTFLTNLKFYSIPLHSIIWVPIVSMVVFLMSFASSYILKKIPIVNKYLV